MKWIYVQIRWKVSVKNCVFLFFSLVHSLWINSRLAGNTNLCQFGSLIIYTKHIIDLKILPRLLKGIN